MYLDQENNKKNTQFVTEKKIEKDLEIFREYRERRFAKPLYKAPQRTNKGDTQKNALNLRLSKTL